MSVTVDTYCPSADTNSGFFTLKSTLLCITNFTLTSL